jgi:protoheme IX farnesyltransferase
MTIISPQLQNVSRETFSSSQAVTQLLEESHIKDFWTLIKPGVLFLVLYTAFVGIVRAPVHVHPFLQFVDLLAIALGSAGAAAFNMWYDRDMDSIMSRTKKRPLPMGRIAEGDCLSFSLLLCGSSLLLMGFSASWLACFWLAFSIVFYTLIYTILLKRSTPQNIVIGGAAGAFPPLIAWISQTGSVALEPLVLVLLIFMWTPSHFWALALFRAQDYASAQVPMLPIVRGTKVTLRYIVAYSFALIATSFLPVMIGVTGRIYFWGALILDAIYAGLAIWLWIAPTPKRSMQLFAYSIVYLFGLFTLLLFR